MEGEDNAERVPQEQTRLVRDLLKRSGVTQELISRRSEEASTAFKEFCPGLPGALTAPTLSRMKTGSGLKKLKRGKLQLLHLTITYVNSPRPEGEGAVRRALAEAEAFADAVLSAGGTAEDLKLSRFNPNDPRHDRMADLFGGHGISLLERAIAQNDANSFREIAVLQWLSGNSDDARHWNECASQATTEALETLDAEVAVQEAYALGLSYLFESQGQVAEIYLALAAESGHEGAALLLREAGAWDELRRKEKNRSRFSAAQGSGHGEAGNRLPNPGNELAEG
jgi:hypothetical protein